MSKKKRLAFSVERLGNSCNKRHLFYTLYAIRYTLPFIFLFSLMGMAPKPKVYIQKLKNARYRLIVDRKPYFIKGVCYSPVPIGKGHDYDFWSDPNEPWKVDGQLMKDMGVNTVRFYQAPENPEAGKKVINDLYQLYGIRSTMGHWLGFWEYPCPRYADNDFREKIKNEVLDMVKTYKDEPGILLWILGNENNYSFSERVNPWGSPEIDAINDIKKRCDLRAGIYYAFVNELAQEIHKIDPNHPVALGNGELISLETANQLCPDIDLVALIVYRGKTFGSLFRSLRATFDKPVMISEFGADSYDSYLNKEDQNMQAFFLEAQWRELFKNAYPNKEGAGNCLGGTMFEWNDEWWKHNQAAPHTWGVHDTESNWSNGSYYFDIKAKANMNMNEEWFGIVAFSQGAGPDLDSKPGEANKEGAEDSDKLIYGNEDGGQGVDSAVAPERLDKRIPRKSYYVLRDYWKNPISKSKIKNQKSK